MFQANAPALNVPQDLQSRVQHAHPVFNQTALHRHLSQESAHAVNAQLDTLQTEMEDASCAQLTWAIALNAVLSQCAHYAQ